MIKSKHEIPLTPQHLSANFRTLIQTWFVREKVAEEALEEGSGEGVVRMGDKREVAAGVGQGQARASRQGRQRFQCSQGLRGHASACRL